MRLTYQFKLYTSKRNKHIHTLIDRTADFFIIADLERDYNASLNKKEVEH